MRSISSVSSVASIFNGTNFADTSCATVGSDQVCTSSSLQAAHQSAPKSMSNGFPVARDWFTAIVSSCSQAISAGLVEWGEPTQPNSSPMPATSSTKAPAFRSFSRRSP